MLTDFKIDLIHLAFFLLSILLWWEFESLSNPKIILLGLLVGTTVLIKVSILPFYVMLFGVQLLLAVRNSYEKSYFISFRQEENLKLIAKLAVIAVVTVFIQGIWTIDHGYSIPWSKINIYPFGVEPKVTLDHNKATYAACMKEQKDIDFKQFFGYDGIWKQPYIYLLRQEPIDRYFYTGIAPMNPGFIIYLACILFIPLMIFKFKELFIRYSAQGITLMFATFLFLIFYFLYIEQVYWYLICLFPFIIPPVLNFFHGRLNKLILVSLSFSYVFITILLMHNLLLFQSNPEFDTKNKRRMLTVSKSTSDFINRTEGLVMDASPWPEQVFLTFVRNYDKRVLREPVYFGYTEKSDNEIKTELKNNNIDYIVIRASTRKYIKFWGCPLKHIERSREFVRKNGELVYIMFDPDIEIYKIY